ncbi:MAG: hypothetical protein KC589_02585 [Nanoarchaeota archaeon]|nr:hypothetical protein [Nanoarchaeota archaeon]MCA9495803.1 hypothetical protein [Nanoarchaeota archaeon]
MKFKILFLFFLSFIFFVSCSGELPSCSDKDTDYVKYAWNDETKACEVIKKISKNKCGNGVQEGSESYCNCPSDVDKDLPMENGGCSGNKGDYLEYICNEKKLCELEITDKVKKTPKSLLLRSGADVILGTKVNYYVPFMLDRHNVEVELSLNDFLNKETQSVKNIIVRTISIETQSKEFLGSVTLNKKFSEKFEKIDAKIPLDAFTLDTFNKDMKSVYVKVQLSFDKVTYNSNGEELRTETKEIILQEIFETKLPIIDPQNKNEDLEGSGSEWNI